MLLYGASDNEISRNGIVSNSISNNHGYGIRVFNKPSQNKAVLNTVRFNTTELTDLSDGSGNTWNVNNIC